MMRDWMNPHPDAPVPSIEDWIHSGQLLHDLPRAKRARLADQRFWWREPGLFVPLSCAIGLDAATDGGIVNPGSSLSFSHTVGGGANTLLIAIFFASSTDVVTAHTYNGVAMTLVNKIQTTGDRWIYMTYMLSPPAGAHNVVITTPGGDAIGGHAASYTGVKQQGPDSSNTATVGSATSITPATTVVATSWLFMGTKNSVGLASAGTGTTSRVSSASGHGLFDSNGDVASGSRTLQATIASSGNLGAVIASFEPAAGGAVSWGPLLGGRNNRLVA